MEVEKKMKLGLSKTEYMHNVTTLHPLHKGDDEFSKMTVMDGLKSFARNGGKPGMGAS